MTRREADTRLIDELASGDYVIDEHAVAEAMLARLMRSEPPRSAMLVADEPGHAPAARVGEDRAAAGPALA